MSSPPPLKPRLLQPVFVETNPAELERALEEHDTVVDTLVAAP